MEGGKLSAALLHLLLWNHVQREVQQSFTAVVSEIKGARIMHLGFRIISKAAGHFLHHLSYRLADG